MLLPMMKIQANRIKKLIAYPALAAVAGACSALAAEPQLPPGEPLPPPPPPKRPPQPISGVVAPPCPSDAERETPHRDEKTQRQQPVRIPHNAVGSVPYTPPAKAPERGEKQ